MAASKWRQADIPSVHVCVPVIVHTCACDVRFLMDKSAVAPKEVHLKSFPWWCHHTALKRKKTCLDDL